MKMWSRSTRGAGAALALAMWGAAIWVTRPAVADVGEPGLPRLAGRWARVQVTTAQAKIPVLGELSSQTVATLLLTVTQRGRELEISEEVCGLETRTSGGLVKTSYPEAFLRAVSGRRTTGHVALDGAKIRYFEGRGESVVRGAKLDDPKETLPASPDDPRLVDGDLDGKPGLTVEVSGFVGGHIYVVQRGGQQFSGLFRSPEEIEGGVRWWTEQNILGADKDILKNGPATRPDTDPAKNRFRMRRVADDLGCAELMSRSKELLGELSVE